MTAIDGYLPVSPPAASVPPVAQVGRRERAKEDKRARIFSAASAAFAEHGFDRVTTQQIADRADVGTGTLFRYAATKGELFLMVYNERFADAVEAGALASRRHTDRTDRTDAVHALVDPVLTWARSLGDSADYQRELLFGPAGERYRDEGLAIVADLQNRITTLLLTDQPDPTQVTTREAHRAARSVFAILNLLLVQPLNDLHPESDASAELHAQIAQVVRGYVATTDTPDTGSR
ncbi:transcriptional regulator, TetR family [Sanguibacter gelidistatuariae]|uniref:Transcriptional regulator, TetR family n=1 Tax=Sanguibacter gelidistatuariae TaxID=1814289 RepID=A0A1G6H4C2_9MICO|nr:TetR/AcrR family transcriptional regulator [Sanguibacter gelidistatuariae]SDB89139.1 transcriptional regulator, TetR family [Sanguibacter gelidistatuariae]